MPSTWAGTSNEQAVTQAAAINAVSLGELVWRTSQPASWNQPGRALPWREIIDHIRTLPGAPDGRDPNDPPPVEDPIMGRCPAKADVITWRQIVVQPTVPVPGIEVVRGTGIMPPDVRATWDTVGQADPNWQSNVNIQWWINGQQWETNTYAQSLGQTPLREVAYGDSVYVRAWYSNSAGSGPVSQSPTLFI